MGSDLLFGPRQLSSQMRSRQEKKISYIKLGENASVKLDKQVVA